MPTFAEVSQSFSDPHIPGLCREAVPVSILFNALVLVLRRGKSSVATQSKSTMCALARVISHCQTSRVFFFVLFVRPCPKFRNCGDIIFVHGGSVAQCVSSVFSTTAVWASWYSAEWKTTQKQGRRRERTNKSSTGSRPVLYLALFSSFFTSRYNCHIAIEVAILLRPQRLFRHV